MNIGETRRGVSLLLPKPSDALRDNPNNILVERVRDNHLFGWVLDIGGKRFGCGELHLVGDGADTILERSLEYPGEGEDIVELIREIGPSCGDNPGSSGSGVVGHDLGNGIRHGEYDCVRVHGSNILGSQGIRSTYPHEYIGSYDCITEHSGDIPWIGPLQQFLFFSAEIGSGV